MAIILSFWSNFCPLMIVINVMIGIVYTSWAYTGTSYTRVFFLSVSFNAWLIIV